MGGERTGEGWRLIWQLAGILGIDPGPLTLRELVWMAEARIEQAWRHTSSVMALIANAHRDPKKHRAFRPSDFDPTRQGKKDEVVANADISILKQVFVDRGTVHIKEASIESDPFDLGLDRGGAGDGGL